MKISLVLLLVAVVCLAATPAPRPIKRVESASPNVAIYADGGSFGIYVSPGPGRH